MADDVGSMIEQAVADSDVSLDSNPAKDKTEQSDPEREASKLQYSQESLGLLFIGGMLIGYGIGKP